MKALICNALCFKKTENDRFGPNSGGVFMTQRFGRIYILFGSPSWARTRDPM